MSTHSTMQTLPVDIGRQTVRFWIFPYQDCRERREPRSITNQVIFLPISITDEMTNVDMPIMTGMQSQSSWHDMDAH
jgi:hypothetical protein